MKKIIVSLSFILVLVSGLLFASSLEVLKTDGTTVSIELDEITNIIFTTSGTIPDGMVLVHGGSFDMGDHYSEGGNDELPVHTVELASYYMGKYEVTQLQYETVIGSNPSSSNYGFGDDFPVNTISYYDIMVYCNTLSISENLTPCYTISGSTDPISWGAVPANSNNTWNAVICDFSVNGYRLPTEAEWEYAAKGGSNWEDYNRYSGCIEETELTNYAWYSLNSGSISHEVGTKLPNQLGIYDMSGNLWELCYDWYNSSYYTSSPSNYPTGPSSGSTRVVRGGFWNRSANFSRCADRLDNLPSDRNNFIGFRVARTVE